MTPDLLTLYPQARAFVVRMRGVDPSYGSQLHQRQFVARLHQMQCLRPCTTDHEHVPACYPQEVIDQAAYDMRGVV
jgi:hypothetical protein